MLVLMPDTKHLFNKCWWSRKLLSLLAVCALNKSLHSKFWFSYMKKNDIDSISQVKLENCSWAVMMVCQEGVMKGEMDK